MNPIKALDVAKHWLFLAVAGVAAVAIAVLAIYAHVEHSDYIAANKDAAGCHAAIQAGNTNAKNQQKALDKSAINEAKAVARTQASTAAAAQAALREASSTVASLTQELNHAYDHSSSAAVRCAMSAPPRGVQLAAAAALCAALTRRASYADGPIQPGAETTAPLPTTVGNRGQGLQGGS